MGKDRQRVGHSKGCTEWFRRRKPRKRRQKSEDEKKGLTEIQIDGLTLGFRQLGTINVK